MAPTRDELRDRASRAYREALGVAPGSGAWAPGRVNIIGEHTDYNAGLALPIAIDYGCVAVGGPGRGRGDRVVAADLGDRFDTAGDDDGPRGWPAWARYVLGAIALTREALGRDGPVDIAFASSVPVGAGLSSSASLEVAASTLCETVLGATLDPLEKARVCQRAEHEFAGVPCGLMDQLVSVAARADEAMLIDFREDTWRYVPAPAPGTLLVVDSGVRHELAAGEYAKRRRSCERAAEALGVPSLREAEATAYNDRRLDHVERRCAKHVITEIERTSLAASALKTGQLRDLGHLMIESHRSLRDDYRVSCPEVDAIVDAAVASPGVYGARMTGGGFGGCAIVLGEAHAISRLAGQRLAGERARFVVAAGAGATPI